MAKVIRVRRERPSVLSWTIALALTMLVVYLMTLGYSSVEAPVEAVVFANRVTQEISFAGISVHFAALGVYDNAILARMEAAKYAEIGAAGCVYEDENGFHVLGACYQSRTDAERIAKRLTQQEALSGTVLSLAAPQVDMRIVASEAEIEAIVQADRVLRAQIDETAALALKLDRGEVSASSARTLLSLGKTEVTEAKNALHKIAGAADNKVCAGLAALLTELEGELATLSKQRMAAAAFTGRLRLCNVSLTLKHIAFLNGLTR